MIARKMARDQEGHRQERGELDPVLEAGRESFPTSDPPAWTLGVPHDDETESPREDGDEPTAAP